KDGQLVMPGLTPLPLQAVAAKAHARNGVTGAMAHGFNRWAWARATFTVGGQPWTADIDALAVRRGAGKFVSALCELPPRRRPSAPRRHGPAPPATGRARRGRSWPANHALFDLPPTGELRSGRHARPPGMASRPA